MYINAQGWVYSGDRLEGDRDATPEEIETFAAETRKAQALERIVALEREDMIPRAVREYMLADFKDKVDKDPLLNAAYARLKARDEEIKALRAIATGQRPATK
jgi:hypothetical protein